MAPRHRIATRLGAQPVGQDRGPRLPARRPCEPPGRKTWLTRRSTPFLFVDQSAAGASACRPALGIVGYPAEADHDRRPVAAEIPTPGAQNPAQDAEREPPAWPGSRRGRSRRFQTCSNLDPLGKAPVIAGAARIGRQLHPAQPLRSMRLGQGLAGNMCPPVPPAAMTMRGPLLFIRPVPDKAARRRSGPAARVRVKGQKHAPGE